MVSKWGYNLCIYGVYWGYNLFTNQFLGHPSNFWRHLGHNCWSLFKKKLPPPKINGYSWGYFTPKYVELQLTLLPTGRLGPPLQDHQLTSLTHPETNDLYLKCAWKWMVGRWLLYLKCAWKWMVGRWLSFWGPAYFQVRTVSFREGKLPGYSSRRPSDTSYPP